MDVLRTQLNLSESDLPDDDIPVALSTLILGAASDKNNDYTLDQVYQAIIAAELLEEIDPLSTVPILLPRSEDISRRILNAVAENTNAKELVIACEEATEKLKGNLINASADEEDDADSLGGDEEIINVSPAQQVARLLDIYAKALPRLKRGKRSPSSIIRPLFSELEQLIGFLGQNAEVEDGRELGAAVAQLVLSLAPWVSIDVEDKVAASEILYSLTISTLEVCAESISSGVAQRAFEKEFPRFRMPARAGEVLSSHEAHSIAADNLHALAQLGFTSHEFERRRSIGSLVLLSHTQPYSPTVTIIQSFLPIIITSIQTNTALEDTLAFLLTAFGPLASARPRTEVSSEVLVPLLHVLAPLAGAHPDPPIRHIIFRLISVVLSLSHPTLRFQLLQELLTDVHTTSEQMRVAAIGLVKEAVLEGLSTSAKAPRNIFASPKFMQTFAPIIFKPQLPESVEDNEALQDFLESPEPLRLVESLGLYYVVLQRDINNQTGIRDAGSMRDVEKQLLSMLRQHMDIWNQELQSTKLDETAEDHPRHDTLQLGILEMWLDRIHAAMDVLRTSPPSR